MERQTFLRPREHRLLRRPEFTACYEEGKRFFSPHFVLFVRRREASELHSRIGFAVTKKMGNACVRNRVKRVLREFFRLHQHNLPKALDMVLVPKRHFDAKHCTLTQIEHELTELILKVCQRITNN